MRRLCAVLAGTIAPLVPGCASALPTGFDEEAPDGRIQAIVQAARAGDRSAIPDLIAQLDADDPAVRLFAIRALEQLTGETLGYEHAAPPPEREAAIERWVQWADEAELARAGDGR